ADPAHHVDAVASDGLQVHLVAQGLEAAHDHRGSGPLPHAQRRRAPTRGHLVHHDLVERHVQGRGLRALVNQFPVMVQPVAAAHAAPPSMARRTAIATASGSNPYIETPGPRVTWIAAAISASLASAGRPHTARSIASSAVSGSRKKSPLTWTCAMWPSASSRSTTTSLPPGTLYSPCIPPSVGSPGVQSTPARPSPAVDAGVGFPRPPEDPRVMPVPNRETGPRQRPRGWLGWRREPSKSPPRTQARGLAVAAAPAVPAAAVFGRRHARAAGGLGAGDRG